MVGKCERKKLSKKVEVQNLKNKEKVHILFKFEIFI